MAKAEWRKHGQVWHLHLAGIWVAVVWEAGVGDWRWHNFGSERRGADSEAAAKAAAEAVCGAQK